MLVATRTLAFSAVEMLTNAKWIERANVDFEERTKGVHPKLLIPEGQKAPKSIR